MVHLRTAIPIVVVVGSLFPGRYTRALSNFVDGARRWPNRVVAPGVVLVTDKYPPFGLGP